MQLSRRHFLASAGALPLLATTSSIARTRPWYQKMRRCGEIDFDKTDIGPLDVAACVDYWSSLKVDALLVSAGGKMAYYPTNIPGQHRSERIGARDLFGDFAMAAKARGIRVVARLDCNLAHQETLQLRPEWFVRSPGGQPVKQDGSPWLYQTCMFTGYFTERIPSIIREMNSLYDIDGFFSDGWPGAGGPPACRCEACLRLAARNTTAFTEQHMARVLEIWKLWDNAAKEKKTDSVYAGSLGTDIRTATGLQRLAGVANWINAEQPDRTGAIPIWDCAQQGRITQSVMKGRCITNVRGRSADLSSPLPKTSMSLAQSTAGGTVPSFPWPGNEPEHEFFLWNAKHEAHFVNRKAVATVGVVFSQRINSLYTPPGGGPPTDFLQGMYYALLEGRFLFDFVHEDDLESATLKKYGALILPNTAVLSDAQCASLRAYARNGGGLLGTFETARYDAAGARRRELGLADVFGAAVAGDVEGSDGNVHYATTGEQHAVLAGFEQTTVLPGAEYRLPVKTRLPQPLTVAPAIPASPAGMAYSHQTRTDEPAIVITEEGMSRRVWLPGDVERSFWRSGNTGLSRLLQQAIRWVARDRMPVRVSGEGFVELFAWETEPGYAIHILNYTNPNLAMGSFRETNPLGAQTVRVELPEGTKVRKVQALRAGTELKYKVSGQTLEFVVPGVRDYEVAAVTTT